jgi:hypothetical protein
MTKILKCTQKGSKHAVSDPVLGKIYRLSSGEAGLAVSDDMLIVDEMDELGMCAFHKDWFTEIKLEDLAELERIIYDIE